MNVFNLITRRNELKISIKHLSCKGKCKIHSKKYKSNQIWNNNKYQCESKKSGRNLHEKGFIWNPTTYMRKNGRYAKSIIDGYMIACDEIKKSNK